MFQKIKNIYQLQTLELFGNIIEWKQPKFKFIDYIGISINDNILETLNDNLGWSYKDGFLSFDTLY